MKVGDLVRRRAKRGDPRVAAPMGKVAAIEGDTVAVVSKATGGRCATISRWPARLLEVVPSEAPEAAVTESESPGLRKP